MPESTSRLPQSNHRPPLTSSNSSGRNKRAKQDDQEEAIDEPHKNGTNGTTGNTNGRTKRKGKERDKPITEPTTDTQQAKDDVPDAIAMDLAEPEEQDGVTRCVCGSTGE